MHLLFSVHSRSWRVFLCLLGGICVCCAVPCVSAKLYIYSAREEPLIQPVLERFEEKYGIEISLVAAKADVLIQRLYFEGKATKADMLLTVDAGRLWRAKQLGLLQPVSDTSIIKTIPEKYRDPDGYWFGLSVRARVILANSSLPENLTLDYLDLSRPEWKRNICIRSSNNIYNQSLVAYLIYEHGENASLNWVRGLVSNMARQPSGGDRDQILAAAHGLCSLAVVNTYYLAHMLNSKVEAHAQAAALMRVVWPPKNSHSTHVNISGIGVTRHSKNLTEATLLLEFLLTPEIQEWYGSVNYEYPVRADVKPAPLLQSWGELFASDVPMQALGRLNKLAVQLMDKGGWP